MTKLLLVIIVGFVISGCKPPSSDPLIRNRIFMECLANIPKGPERTVYNDWDEVVKSCDSVAYYQSLR